MKNWGKSKAIEYRIKKTVKQKEAVRLISENETTLLEGGGRSGKTFIVLFILLVRSMLFPGSRHLIARFRFAHAKQAICYDTMPKLLKLTGQTSKWKLNKTDWFYEHPNGSTIWVGGVDDKERLEKILGNEYATIFLNEASQLSYEAYEVLVTRLNPSPGMKAKMIVDYNPPSIHHWGYKIFHLRELPDGRKIKDGDFVKLQMNPIDNQENLGDGYLDRLDNLSEAKRRRFKDGEYSMDGGTLFKRAWIKYGEELPDFHRVVIGVDPAGTEDGDSIGIVAMGLFENKYYVLDDYTLHGSPTEWAAAVAQLYDKWLADVVVAEKNYGGDMVESTLKNAHPSMNVKLIHSSRGKILRAEPISVLYEKDMVIHRTMFNELEDEMCMYKPGETVSPNRLDAMVFAGTELSSEGTSMLDCL